jgi:WS/DGAT/MGAT family acyltransferase
MAIEREALSVVDHAWLRMDRPTNLMMICGLMTFAGRIDLARLKIVVRQRMLCFHRFRQRVAWDAGNAYWETDPGFDLDWHVRQLALPRGAGQRGLDKLTGELVSTALDPTKPMWQMHVIDVDANHSALILRIHHCYGDGFALAHVMGALTDSSATHHALPSPDLDGTPPPRAAWEKVLGQVTELAGDGVRLARSAYGLAADWSGHPERALAAARRGIDLAAELGVIAAMEPDCPTRFKGPLGVMKRVACARTLALDEVKAVASALSCSVNDVLLSCVTAALRRYLLDQDDPVDGVEMRALVPVNLRPPGPVQALGNHFGLVFLGLPLGEADALRRTHEVHARMEALKHSQQATVALGILACMGAAPDGLRETLVEALAANASAVVTNVRGAPEARYLAGQRIDRQVFWVPQSGGIGLGISILSYAGQVNMGVMTDVQRVPDPDVLASHMVTEFESLLLRCLTMPWPGRFAADVGKAAVTASPRRKRSTAKTPGTETEHTS